MIFETEEDLRDFATVYRTDYFKKKIEKLAECKPVPKYPPPLNILNGPYKQYLNTQLENQSLPENEQSEDPLDNLNRIRDKFPHLRNVLPRTVPDENVIECEKKKSWKTVYQLDYSKEYELGHPVKDVTLPEDWILPETVQKRAYRNPLAIVTKSLLKPPKISKPCNNLDPNFKEREILRVTTGNSEYDRTIGAIGKRIVLQSLSDIKENVELQKSKSPEISDSECSLILKQNLVLPSQIF